MSGAKSAGRVIDGSTSKGLYHPQRTSVNNLGSVAQGKPFATSSSNIKAILLTGNVPELIPFKSKQKSSLNQKRTLVTPS
jgi:hypothetical protein